jgi:hypothetical protein
MHGKTIRFAQRQGYLHWTYMSLRGPRISVARTTRGVGRRRQSKRTKSAAKDGYGRIDDRFRIRRGFSMGLVISVFMAVGVKGNYGLIPVHGV